MTDDAPFGDDVAWRRLLTIRGRTGAVLMIHPLQSESAEHIVEAMADNFSEPQLQTTRHIGTDSPSEKLAKQLKLVCPGLRSLMLDPVHLAIVYEYGFWNNKSTGSKMLRRILTKCIAVDTTLRQDHWQETYNGSVARPLSIKHRDSVSRHDAGFLNAHGHIGQSARGPAVLLSVGFYQKPCCLVPTISHGSQQKDSRCEQAYLQDLMGGMRP